MTQANLQGSSVEGGENGLVHVNPQASKYPLPNLLNTLRENNSLRLVSRTNYSRNY